MADHNEIDDLFRGRFEGLRNNSVDPNRQWVAFESELDAAVTASSVGAGAASGASASVWSMAASIAAMVTVAGLVSQDRSLENAEVSAVQMQQVMVEAGLLETPDHIRSSRLISDIKQESAQWPREARIKDMAQDLYPIAVNSEQGQSDQPTTGLDLDMVKRNRSTEVLAKMPAGVSRYEPLGIVDRDVPYEKTYPLFRSSGLYGRVAARTGNGESNSMSNPAAWRLNAGVALGYTHALNAKTFITAEIGLLRRSGNGVERSQAVDLEPLANVLINNYGSGNQDELELRRSVMNIRESLVAKRLDCIHMPIALHVNLTDHSNVAIGSFIEYLIGVENESYMVYNSTDYIRTDFGFNDDRTTDGLNRFRIGLLTSYEHTITDHVTIDARAMIPITSVFDRQGDYYQHAEPNQLVDLQIGLNYKI